MLVFVYPIDVTFYFHTGLSQFMDVCGNTTAYVTRHILVLTHVLMFDNRVSLQCVLFLAWDIRPHFFAISLGKSLPPTPLPIPILNPLYSF